MKIQGKKLTEKQQNFIAWLPKCNYIAMEAVKKAGYRCKDDQAAAEIGCQLLKHAQVGEAVEKMKEARLKKLGIHAERILQNRARVAEGDARRFFKEDGTVKPPQEWDDEMAGCVAGFEVIELFEGKGEDRKMIGYLKKVRLNDRNPAQHDLMDHAQLFPDRGSRVELNVEGDVNLTNIELSARAIYLIKLALERKKQAEERGEITEKVQGERLRQEDEGDKMESQ